MVWYSNSQFMCYARCNKTTILILDQYIRKQDCIHFSSIQMVWLSGVQMGFKYGTVWHPTSFQTFKYPTSSAFRSPLYYEVFKIDSWRIWSWSNLAFDGPKTASLGNQLFRDHSVFWSEKCNTKKFSGGAKKNLTICNKNLNRWRNQHNKFRYKTEQEKTGGVFLGSRE